MILGLEDTLEKSYLISESPIVDTMPEWMHSDIFLDIFGLGKWAGRLFLTESITLKSLQLV
jgi:hypothetical protein